MSTDEWKAYLRSYQSMELEIDRLQEEILIWKSKATKVTQSCSGMPGGSGTSDRVGMCVEKITELQDKLSDRITQLIQRRIDIEHSILSLPALPQEVLRLRYIDGMTFEKVAETVGCTHRHACRIHGRALQTLSQNL